MEFAVVVVVVDVVANEIAQRGHTFSSSYSSEELAGLRHRIWSSSSSSSSSIEAERRKGALHCSGSSGRAAPVIELSIHGLLHACLSACP